MTDEMHRMFHNEWVDLEDKIPASDFEFTYDPNRPTIDMALDEGAYMPERAYEYDAGADIRTPYRFVLPERGMAVVDTGVHIAIPKYHVGMLKSKSGINVKLDATSEGVIDTNYTGSIVVKLYNHGDHKRVFEKGDKVIQIIVMPIIIPSFKLVDSLEDTDRGNNGFGSSGR